MNESRLRARPRRSDLGKRDEAGLERQTAQRDQHPRSRKQRHLADQVLAAICELLRERSIVWRGALDRRRQARAEEIEPVSRSN
jgi:hypothetical protein